MAEAQQHKEHPSTYFVQDRSNKDERHRILIQERMLTEGMGGVLPEQADTTTFRRILDIGCGTGGWLIDVAKELPSATHLAGVDISGSMVEFAREQAKMAEVDERVEFHVMDVLRMIEYPANAFDLVNQRLNFSYLRTWDWPRLLQEYQRVARHGGIIRITEPEILATNNSPALNRLSDLTREAFFNAGHLFAHEREGITRTLPGLMTRHGIADVQTREVDIVYAAPGPGLSAFIEDNQLLFRNIIKFLDKWTRVPANYEQIYQQALVEMQQPDFQATVHLVTAWGVKR